MATINPDSPANPTGNPYLDVLIWGGSWSPALGTGADITWSTKPLVTIDGVREPTIAPSPTEFDAFRNAFAAWAAVCDLTFTEVAPEAGANLRLGLLTAGQMFRLYDERGVYGTAGLPNGRPDEPDGGPDSRRALFNTNPLIWDDGSIQPGGYAFGTVILHEIGHNLGLTHPFNGGPPEASFPKVKNSESLGRHGQAQGIYTVMTYLDPWPEGLPPHKETAWGWQATPMAFDIAAVQVLYGANMATHAGDDLWTLPDANGAGAAWSCLWDAGGADMISAAAALADALIDLRAAPLAGAHAGGFVSHVAGVQGGFTIAHGVVIENAEGGAGADTLTGNAAANRLDGGPGADRLDGRGGDDVLVAGAGDRLRGGGGRDRFVLEAAFEAAAPRIEDFAPGRDWLVLDASAFAGVDAPGAFVAARRAAAPEERLLWDAPSGRLFWDADGSGPEAPMLLAKLAPGTALAASDIILLG